MSLYEVTAYEGVDGSLPYLEFREALRRSGDLKVLRIADAIITKLAEVRLDLLDTNMMDNIEDGIYELRPGNYRLFCLFDRPNNRFVLLNGFRKHTRRTPESEKEGARRLRQEYLSTGGLTP